MLKIKIKKVNNLFFNKPAKVEIKKTKKTIQIKFSDKLEDLQHYIKACDTLGLPFTIVKRNVGGKENPCYFYFFYINFEE
ncbi:hypothetical protein [Clostridium sp. AWRP]|uniref:hypothetical protein n=1 Tax=Clostridium sp. AWRP TaxID=2212991 RepID=UPI001585DE7F|nr:hypothetical protein [Clostridium sp. AWRP]